MAKVLREQRARGTNPSFKELSQLVTAKLRRLKYNQTPNLVGFSKRIAAKIPWAAADADGDQQPAPRKRVANTGKSKTTKARPVKSTRKRRR